MIWLHTMLEVPYEEDDDGNITDGLFLYVEKIKFYSTAGGNASRPNTGYSPTSPSDFSSPDELREEGHRESSKNRFKNGDGVVKHIKSVERGAVALFSPNAQLCIEFTLVSQIGKKVFTADTLATLHVLLHTRENIKNFVGLFNYDIYHIDTRLTSLALVGAAVFTSQNLCHAGEGRSDNWVEKNGAMPDHFRPIRKVSAAVTRTRVQLAFLRAESRRYRDALYSSSSCKTRRIFANNLQRFPSSPSRCFSTC